MLSIIKFSMQHSKSFRTKPFRYTFCSIFSRKSSCKKKNIKALFRGLKSIMRVQKSKMCFSYFKLQLEFLQQRLALQLQALRQLAPQAGLLVVLRLADQLEPLLQALLVLVLLVQLQLVQLLQQLGLELLLQVLHKTLRMELQHHLVGNVFEVRMETVLLVLQLEAEQHRLL